MPWTMSTSTVTGTASMPMHFAHKTFTSIVFFAKMPDKKIKNLQKDKTVAKTAVLWQYSVFQCTRLNFRPRRMSKY